MSRRATHARRADYPPVKTHKFKVSPLTRLQMEKNMFFVIPEMSSKTFAMLLKKLPDHFKPPCTDYSSHHGTYISSMVLTIHLSAREPILIDRGSV